MVSRLVDLCYLPFPVLCVSLAFAFASHSHLTLLPFWPPAPTPPILRIHFLGFPPPSEPSIRFAVTHEFSYAPLCSCGVHCIRFSVLCRFSGRFHTPTSPLPIIHHVSLNYNFLFIFNGSLLKSPMIMPIGLDPLHITACFVSHLAG